MNLAEIRSFFEANSDPEKVAGMARFGIVGKKVYGLSMPGLRKLAKDLGRNHDLALELWADGSRESRILAALIDDPELVTRDQLEAWGRDLDSWEATDQLCMNLAQNVAFAEDLARDWIVRDEEFVKRAGFVLLARFPRAFKKAPDEWFEAFLPLLEEGSDDDRSMVKKAVNWALREIGKKNRGLNAKALETAERIKARPTKSARWIAGDALRELKSEKVQHRLAKKGS